MEPVHPPVIMSMPWVTSPQIETRNSVPIMPPAMKPIDTTPISVASLTSPLNSSISAITANGAPAPQNTKIAHVTTPYHHA